jgi:hypothetical protein
MVQDGREAVLNAGDMVLLRQRPPVLAGDAGPRPLACISAAETWRASVAVPALVDGGSFTYDGAASTAHGPISRSIYFSQRRVGADPIRPAAAAARS